MNILLLYGGKSCEHDISILTAKITQKPLSQIGTLFCVYVDSQNKWWLIKKDLQPLECKSNYKKVGTRVFLTAGENTLKSLKGNRAKDIAKIDVAVPCFHGINGEDGSISGLLQLSNIPYTTGNPFACGLSIDKIATKTYLKGLGLNQLPYVVFRSIEDQNALKLLKKYDFPFIVKPSTQGSSIGIKVVNNLEELNSALNVAFCYDTKVIVEKALTDFFEVNCSATRIKGVVDTSEIEKPIPKENILTFADKYLQNGKEGCERIFPYQFDQTEKIKNITKRIYDNLDFEGIIRVDFLVCNKTKKIYVNEINSIPGSLAFYLWKNKLNHKDLLEQNIIQSIATKRRKDNLVYAYKTDLLKTYSNTSQKLDLTK